jgi:hypothetical protein
MANAFPFEYLNEQVDFFRLTIQNSMKEVYAEIGRNETLKNFYLLSSESVQEMIYQRIISRILDKDSNTINNLKEQSIVATLQRDAVLSRYVKKTLEQIQNGHPEIEAEQAHFLEVMAEDKKTQTTLSRIEPINGYQRENSIDALLINQREKYMPIFERVDGTIATEKDIKIVAVKNLTGIYDVRRVSEIASPEQFLYEIDSRIKRSERELEKFLDWSYGRRDVNDYPYDNMAATIIIPDTDQKGSANGKEIYGFKDFIRSISSNSFDNNSLERNKSEYEKKGIIKLVDRRYNDDNYNAVLTQMDKTAKKIDIEQNRNKKNSEYRVSKNDTERLFQGPQLKHEIEDKNKIETLIQTRTMNKEYKGPRIGHTSFYFADRERDRMLFLLNPATHRYTHIDSSIKELPRIDYLDRKLFSWFIQGFDTTNMLG